MAPHLPTPSSPPLGYAHVATIPGVWEGISAGGGYSANTFSNNPQYTLALRLPPQYASWAEFPSRQAGIWLHVAHTPTTHQKPLAVGIQVCLRNGNWVSNVTQADLLQISLARGTETSRELQVPLPESGSDKLVLTIVPHTLHPEEEAVFAIQAAVVDDLGSSSATFKEWVSPFEHAFEHCIEVEAGWFGSTAGGSINDLTCNRNPQWFLTVPPPPETPGDGDGPHQVDIVVELDQGMVLHPESRLRHICVLVLDKNGARFNQPVVLKSEILGSSGDYTRLRSVHWAGALSARQEAYTLLPTTFEPKDEAPFTLRVYSSSPVKLEAAPEFAGSNAEYGNKVTLRSAWDGITAGGCLNFPTAINNPMFYLSSGSSLPYTVEITLTQGEVPGEPDAAPNHVGILVGRTFAELVRNNTLADSGPFVNARAISLSVEIQPSPTPVCVLVATFNPGEARAFTLSFESNVVLQVIPSILDTETEYTAVSSMAGAWRSDNEANESDESAEPSVPISYFDNPQYALSVTVPNTTVSITLSQAPPVGSHFLEQAIIVADAGGERLIHNGFTCIADSGDYLAQREVSIVLDDLNPEGPVLTLMPTNLTPGIATDFMVVVRATAPVTLTALPYLDETEVNSKLITDLETEETQLHALSTICTRVDASDNIDTRIRQREKFERLGLADTLRKVSSVTHLDDDMRAAIDEYNDERDADNQDMTAQVNVQKLEALGPVWSVPVSIQHEDDAVTDILLDSRIPAWSLVEYILDSHPLPDSLTSAHVALFLPPREQDADAQRLSNDDTLSMYLRIATDQLTLMLKARQVPIELDMGASVTRSFMVDVTTSVPTAIAQASKAFNLPPHEMGLLLIPPTCAPKPLPRATLRVKKAASSRRGRYTSFSDDTIVVGENGLETGEGPERWLEEGEALTVALDEDAEVLLARRPLPVHVDVHFFEIIRVTVRVTFSTRVRDVKSRIMAAPELTNHIVPSLFKTHGLFSVGSDGNPIPLDPNKSLSDAGLVPGDLVMLRLKNQDDEEEEGGDADGESGDDASHSVSLWDDTERNASNWREEGGELSAASLNQLILKLTSLDNDLEFQETFLLTYESFTTAEVVMDKLVERFRVPPQDQLPEYASLSPQMFENTVVIPIRHQVLSTVIAWAQYFSKYMDPEEKAQLEATAFAVDPKRSMTSFVKNCLALHDADADEEPGAAVSEKLLLRVKVGIKSKVLSFDGDSVVADGKALIAKKFELGDEPPLEAYQFSTYKLGVLDETLAFRDVGLSNLDEVFFGVSNLEVGELVIPEDEKVLLRIQLEDGVSKMMTFGRNVSVAEMQALIAFKFGLDPVDGSTLSLLADEYGKLDVEQSLLAYPLKNKTTLVASTGGGGGGGSGPGLSSSGSSSSGGGSGTGGSAGGSAGAGGSSTSTIISVVCDDKSRREFVFPSSTTVSSALNHVGVSFGILELDKYELKCVAFGRMAGAETLGSYSLPPRSEVYFTRRNLIDGTNETLNYTLIRPPIVVTESKIPKPKVPKRRARNLTIWDINEAEAARQLTLMDHEAYARIEPIELLDQAWTKEKYAYRCANLLAFIHRFNRISSWVAQTILAESKVRRRAQVMKWHIKLASELRKLNNFHAVMAVLGGLGNPAVSRLKWTKDRLGRSSNKTLAALEALMTMEMGYSVYRAALAASERAIPYVGANLCDIIFIQDGNADVVDGLVHWSKFSMLRTAISNIRSFQSRPYNFVVVENLQRYLNRVPIVGDDETYGMSLRLEPRGAGRMDIE